MIPFYIYYSMFGFQRIGDLAWAAGDMHARGFLIGGTAGRTTWLVKVCNIKMAIVILWLRPFLIAELMTQLMLMSLQ